jgi:hypothetical protein
MLLPTKVRLLAGQGTIHSTRNTRFVSESGPRELALVLVVLAAHAMCHRALVVVAASWVA